MNLLVLMSGSFRDKTALFTELDRFPIKTLLSTGEAGHGMLEEYAKERGLVLVTNNASKGEGEVLKNRLDTIVAASYVLVYHDGESKGTEISLDMCRREKKLVKLIKFDSPLKDFYFFVNHHPFSLDYPTSIKIWDKEFYNAKHCLTYAALKMAKSDLADAVLDLDFPKKSAAKKLNDYFGRYAVTSRLKLIHPVNKAKFRDPELKKFLLETKGYIVFCGAGPLGCGFLKTDPAIYDVQNWDENLLGKSLDKLRHEYSSDS